MFKEILNNNYLIASFNSKQGLIGLMYYTNKRKHLLHYIYYTHIFTSIVHYFE